AHHRTPMTIDHRRAESRQVSLFQVARAWMDVGGVAGGFWSAMNGKMFARRDRPWVIPGVALPAGNECYAHLAGQERVFAVSLLPAPPAGIAKDIDIRRPEGKAVEDAMI